MVTGQVWLWIGLVQTKRRRSLMFVGLQRSEVMAKTGFFFIPNWHPAHPVQASDAKRFQSRPLGLGQRNLIESTHDNELEKKEKTVG